ncbi:transposable element Tcb2 transposase [Trichonephila clavipes]|nr:transposable element Tcb2 transposase [Trichonephila clavipes]
MIARHAQTAPTVPLPTFEHITAFSIPCVVSTTISTRLEWCHNRYLWLSSDWHPIVFSDESRFTLESDGHRRVCSGRVQRSQSVLHLQRHTAATPRVTVGGGAISYDRRSSLVNLHTSPKLNDMLMPAYGRFYYPSWQGPVSNKMMIGRIPITYLCSVIVPLILFHGQTITRLFTN